MAGMSAKDIYDRVHSGPGTSSLAGAHDVALTLAANHKALAVRVEALRQRMEAAWVGDASAAAHQAAGPLVTAFDRSGAELDRAQNVLFNQSDSFDTVKRAVVPVAEAPPVTGFMDVVTPWDTDTEDAVNQYNSAAEHNFRVYTAYAGDSNANAVGMPREYGEVPPAFGEVAIKVPEPSDGDGGRGGPSQPGTSDGGGGGPTPAQFVQAPGQPGGPSTGAGGGALVPPGQSTEASGFQPPTGGSPVPVGSGLAGASAGSGGSGGFSGGVGAVLAPGAGGSGAQGGRFGGGHGGAGGPGAGVGRGVPGGVAGGGGADAHAGPRSGAGPVSGEPAGQRGASGAAGRSGGAAGMGGMGGGTGARGGEDSEYERATYLREHDPDELFGTDEITAPPVIGL
ncbi:hypothetical protein [Actinokineospora sp.]|uniref:hypothetical protein n=1 Tax=Actinokineospora sp. TaxID=1872133 RepID=UPI004037AB45